MSVPCGRTYYPGQIVKVIRLGDDHDGWEYATVVAYYEDENVFIELLMSGGTGVYVHVSGRCWCGNERGNLQKDHGKLVSIEAVTNI